MTKERIFEIIESDEQALGMVSNFLHQVGVLMTELDSKKIGIGVDICMPLGQFELDGKARQLQLLLTGNENMWMRDREIRTIVIDAVVITDKKLREDLDLEE